MHCRRCHISMTHANFQLQFIPAGSEISMGENAYYLGMHENKHAMHNAVNVIKWLLRNNVTFSNAHFIRYYVEVRSIEIIQEVYNHYSWLFDVNTLVYDITPYSRDDILDCRKIDWH